MPCHANGQCLDLVGPLWVPVPVHCASAHFCRGHQSYVWFGWTSYIVTESLGEQNFRFNSCCWINTICLYHSDKPCNCTVYDSVLNCFTVPKSSVYHCDVKTIVRTFCRQSTLSWKDHPPLQWPFLGYEQQSRLGISVDILHQLIPNKRLEESKWFSCNNATTQRFIKLTVITFLGLNCCRSSTWVVWASWQRGIP